jgi:hypothetical protein
VGWLKRAGGRGRLLRGRGSEDEHVNESAREIQGTLSRGGSLWDKV